MMVPIAIDANMVQFSMELGESNIFCKKTNEIKKNSGFYLFVNSRAYAITLSIENLEFSMESIIVQSVFVSSSSF